MKRNFELELGYYTATPELQPVSPAPDPKPQLKPWQFVNDFQQLAGNTDSEPDPQFFVETWTLGAAVAMENFRQRQLRQSDRAARTAMFRQFPNVAPPVMEQDTYTPAEQLRPAQAIEAHSQSHYETTAANPDAPQEWASFAQEFVDADEMAQPMTQDNALRLLGVTARSTQAQLRAAYRRMVTDWHPDRFQARPEKVRKQATEKMAAINAAYHLLRDALSKAV